MRKFYSWQIAKYAERKLYEKCIIMYFSGFHFFAAAAAAVAAPATVHRNSSWSNFFLLEFVVFFFGDTAVT